MRALTLSEVTAKIGGGKTFVYASMKAGTFPKPIRVGRRSSWIESEVNLWLEARIAERDSGIADAITQRARNAAAAKQARGAA